MNIVSKKIALIGLLAVLGLGTVRGADPFDEEHHPDRDTAQQLEYNQRRNIALGKANFNADFITNQVTHTSIETVVQECLLAKKTEYPGDLIGAITAVFQLREELIHRVPREYPVSHSPYPAQVIELLRTIITPENVADIIKKTDINVMVPELGNITALHIAARNNAPEEVIDTLINAGIPINSADNWEEETPLHYAATWGHEHAVRTLLKRGAKVNVVDHQRNTPLLLATRRNNPPIARLLLARRAWPTIYNNQGETDLLIATTRGYYEIVQILLEHGANLFHGYDYERLANSKNHTAIANLIRERKATILQQERERNRSRIDRIFEYVGMGHIPREDRAIIAISFVATAALACFALYNNFKQ